MLNLPILRWGSPYTSLEQDTVVHFMTGETLARVSQANTGLIGRDMREAGRARQILTEIPITELIEKSRLDALVQRTRDGGAEIVKYLKTGSAYYAPSAAATEMVEAILKDKKKILPCAAYLQGEYGINGLYVGVPCKLGAKGLEQIIEIKLTPEEKAGLDKSAAAVKELVGVIGV